MGAVDMHGNRLIDQMIVWRACAGANLHRKLVERESDLDWLYCVSEQCLMP